MIVPVPLFFHTPDEDLGPSDLVLRLGVWVVAITDQ